MGLSGGVDSSVAAYLLKKHGYAVTGVFMRSYNIDGCAETDAEDARRVAEKLGIPFYVWDFEEEYKKKVVEYMVAGYRTGLTPNPDVMCNREIKFGIFMERALALGADYVATGHYVKRAVSAEGGSAFGGSVKRLAVSVGRKLNAIRYTLYAAHDSNKDQSYFLWTLTQNELRHCLFPIGSYLKSEVRVIARRAGLLTAEKKDSQGICFLGQITLADFLKNYIPEKIGKIITVGGKKIGEHSGACFYTIGQRHGLNLSDKRQATSDRANSGGFTRPFYVAAKNVKTNTLVVAEGDDHPSLYRKEVRLSDVNFIYPLPTTHYPLFVMARIRYRQLLSSATLTCRQSSVVSCKLVFDNPQKFIAPGQSAVFYSKSGEMLGGGVIV